MKNQLTLNWAKDLVYIYTSSKLLQEWPGANPMVWYKKNKLSKDSMSNVDENENETKSSDEDPIELDELDENEDEHDPFEFPNDDEIPFSILLSHLMVW